MGPMGPMALQIGQSNQQGCKGAHNRQGNSSSVRHNPPCPHHPVPRQLPMPARATPRSPRGCDRHGARTPASASGSPQQTEGCWEGGLRDVPRLALARPSMMIGTGNDFASHMAASSGLRSSWSMASRLACASDACTRSYIPVSSRSLELGLFL